MFTAPALLALWNPKDIPLGLFAFPESQIPSAFRFPQIRNPQSAIQNRNALCSQSLNS
jgi:hypothetical protein